MTPRARPLITLVSLAALAAGCGGGDGPTGPAPNPESPSTSALTLDFAYVEVIEDCDGVEGDGDFQFDVRFGPGDPATTERVYGETVNLPPGGTTRVIGERSYEVTAVDGVELSVGFRATELDKTLLGAEYNDERLDGEFGSMRYVYSNGTWSNLGSRSITLGSSGCQVRLHWAARAT